MGELPDRTEVLAVGAGPVGLAVAASWPGMAMTSRCSGRARARAPDQRRQPPSPALRTPPGGPSRSFNPLAAACSADTPGRSSIASWIRPDAQPRRSPPHTTAWQTGWPRYAPTSGASPSTTPTKESLRVTAIRGCRLGIGAEIEKRFSTRTRARETVFGGGRARRVVPLALPGRSQDRDAARGARRPLLGRHFADRRDHRDSTDVPRWSHWHPEVRQGSPYPYSRRRG
jgi:hypothetical protein